MKYIEHRSDHSGPWATTGTSEGIDEFDIKKLQKMYPQAKKFIMDNIQAIFKGLQKKKYSHALGYYTFIGYSVVGDTLRISRSSTTYYN